MTDSTPVAESIAILEGLLMAEAEKKRIALRVPNKLEKAVVRSDSSEAVNLVNSRTRELTAELLDIIQTYRDVLDSNPEFSVEFVYREGNVIADSLVTTAIRFRFSQKWVDHCPITTIMLEEIR